jgi:membrane protease YdiL (CAAX protease family)
MVSLKGMCKQNGVFSNLLLLLGTAVFFALMAIVIWKIIFGANPTGINSMRWLQFAEAIGMFVVPPFVLAYFWSDKPFKYLCLDKKPDAVNVLFVILFMVLAIPFVNLLGEWNQQLKLPHALGAIEAQMKASEAEIALLTKKLLDVHSLKGLFGNVFLIAFIPALGEELFFRGALQQIFQNKKNAIMAIWLTAFIFSAIHFQFYGFVPRFLLGAFFGYLLVWSGNLWLPVLAHFANNAIAIVFYYLKYNGFQVVDIDTIGTGNTLWIGCVSGLLALIMIVLFRAKLRVTNF